MRAFMILCFAALTAAAPQGYNYAYQPDNHYSAPTVVAGASYGGQGSYGYQQQPLITKRFFLHSAPEEQDTEVQHRDIVVGQPRKNFNVVFIKSPIAAAQKTKVRILPAINEDKTVIYVLAKKSGEHDVITHVEEPHITTSKPEVFFIKYKTNEEAEHAQRNIQAEYDNLGGSSIVSNEGLSPVSSVIGSLDNHNTGVVESGVPAVTGAGRSGYLPPANRH